MDILDYFYNLDYSNIVFFPRKYKLNGVKRLFIYGSCSSGKSYIVLDYLNSLDSEKTLYVDLKDPKLIFNQFTIEDINSFIKKNSIETLVLDHYTPNMFNEFPSVRELIVISNYFSIEFSRFELLKISLLDYEEFFSFQKKNSQKYIFNLFVKRGTILQLAIDIDRPREELFHRFLNSSFSILEQNLLIVLSHFNCSNVTTYQIYTYAKRRFRISKNSVYKKIKELLDREIIFFIDSFTNEGIKKLILFDFALANYLSLSQKFLRQFDAMIALSLIKHGVEFKSFDIVGYITSNKNLIIPAPFDSEDSSYQKSKSKLKRFMRYKINSVYIITVSTQYSFNIGNISFEALPFYEWVLINDEF